MDEDYHPFSQDKYKIKYEIDNTIKNSQNLPIPSKSTTIKVNGYFEVTIKLNKDFLTSNINASQEFVAACILHEMMHGIVTAMNWDNLAPLDEDLEQHYYFWTKEYEKRIGNSLHDIFPNLVAGDALALGLSGMDDLIKPYNVNTGQYEFDPTMNSNIQTRYGSMVTSEAIYSVIRSYMLSQLGTDFCN